MADVLLLPGADLRVARKNAVQPVVQRQVRKGRRGGSGAVGFQRRQTLVQRAAQQGVAGDKAVHLQTLCLQSCGALAQKFRVKAGLRAGVEVVHGDDRAAACRQLPCHLRGGGRSVDGNGQLLRKGAHPLQREAVVQPQTPQVQPLCQRGQVGAAELPDGLFRHVCQNAPALCRQKVAHFLHAGAVSGIKFFADMQ